MNIELREDGALEIDGRIVRFPQRIFRIADPMVGRNILALDRQGKLLWRVEDHGFEYQDPDADRLLPQPFIGLGVNSETGKLEGVLPYVYVTIDEKTGGVSDPVINR